MPEHRDITGADLHEPKGVAGASEGEFYRADGEGSGSWTPGTGWTTYLDSAYTVSAKRSVTASTRTKVTIDGLALQDGNGGVNALWDTATNKVVAFNENDLYAVRFDFKAQSATASAYVDVEYDVGGTAGVILNRTSILTKTSATNNIVHGQTMFVGSDFFTNGLEIYVTPSADTDFWDFGILITRIHTAIT